jgi:hypothetical protein
MSLDYRAADRQPDTHAAALGRVERIEQLVHALTLDPDTGIPHVTRTRLPLSRSVLRLSSGSASFSVFDVSPVPLHE